MKKDSYNAKFNSFPLPFKRLIQLSSDGGALSSVTDELVLKIQHIGKNERKLIDFGEPGMIQSMFYFLPMVSLLYMNGWRSLDECKGLFCRFVFYWTGGLFYLRISR